MVVSMPDDDLINIYYASNLEIFQQIQGDKLKFRDIGSSLQLQSRIIGPKSLEVHSLFYSSVNNLELTEFQDPSKQNARIGLLQMYHPSEYAPAPEFWINNQSAI